MIKSSGIFKKILNGLKRPIRIKDLWVPFTLSLLISTSICLLGPYQVVLGNPGAVSVGLKSLLVFLIKPWATSWLILFVIIFIGNHFYRNFPVFFLAMAIGFWIQGNFFLWEYGTLDGADFDWSVNSGKGILEVIFWLALFLICVRFRKRLLGFILPAVIGLLVIQGGDLAIKFHTGEFLAMQLSGDARKTATFSRNRNIIMIVLDAFQSDHFNEALQKAQLSQEDFRGFVHYRNNVSQYSHTTLSVPSYLSSELYVSEFYRDDKILSKCPDNWVSSYENWGAVVMKRSAPALLADQGVAVDIVAFSPTSKYYKYGDSNKHYRSLSLHEFLKLSGIPDVNRDENRILLSISLYRHVPHFIKKFVYNNGDWIFTSAWLHKEKKNIHRLSYDDLKALSILPYSISMSDTPLIFKIFHFFMPHRPFDADEKCEYNGQSSDRLVQLQTSQAYRRNGAIGSSACILKKIVIFFNALEKFGIYDNSLIFVMGDHGNQALVHLDNKELIKEGTYREEEIDPTNIPANIGHGIPLLLIKKPFENSKLKNSDAPVALSDIPATIFEFLGMAHSFNGRSIFEIEKNEQRTRIHHVSHSWGMTRYRINGHSWLKSSWARVSKGFDSRRPTQKNISGQ